ncbi:MAG: zinc-ribbon domain-containing protein, partial [Deltaproteobacteria bacterium]|nr:zinc-ribbon domain-containing protein [Deltaproteobacteria bacterium]
MIVICEECGKKYQIDPLKIKGKEARFKCKACNNVITVSKPEEEPPSPPPPPPTPVEEPAPPAPEPEKEKEPPKKKGRKTEAKKKRAPKKPGSGFKGPGLRGKMTILFLLIPVIVFIAAGMIYLKQLNNLSSELIEGSSKVVTQMAEKAIAENARAVAREASLYLQKNPDRKRENFDKDVDFRRVAVQKVGLTGYTALYEFPDSNGVWRTWAHANPKIIGIDMSKLKK